MVSDSLTVLNRKRVIGYAAAKRLPAIYEYDPMVRDGGLMSYGPDLSESFKRAAAMVDRIFKGAKPSELPFEQLTRYLFVLNLKTAKGAWHRHSAEPSGARRRGDRIGGVPPLA
jgi:putative ABC transport system substrate-binding protein